jgi:homoserine kinase
MPKTRKPAPPPGPVELVLPATSANLGPAFDAAALALNLYLRVRARPSAHFSVTADGRDRHIIAPAENHLILNTYREILEAERISVLPIALHLANQIPIGKGCGSSAAARLAGIALAVHFGGLDWRSDRIIGEAARREHHPDNAAACWLGGLAVARMTGENHVQTIRLTPKGKWPLLLAIPEGRLSTEAARRVLPAHYSRADAVANIQNSMLLLASFTQGRRDLLPAALQDRIHQPYRAPLCPLLPALLELAGTNGILGVALSGAGPSVLVFVDPDRPLQRARNSIAGQLRKNHLSAELLLTSIAAHGASEGRDWKRKHPARN